MSSAETIQVAHLEFLFPHFHITLQAESWASLIKAIDHDKDTCFVNSIKYCKCQDGKKHEILVTEIVHQPTGLTNTVIVDHAPQASSNNDSVTHASNKISSQVAAHDQVRIGGSEELHDITHGFQPFEILLTHTFTSPPSLLEPAVLVVVVHEMTRLCTKESKAWCTHGKYGAISVAHQTIAAEFVEALVQAQGEAMSRKEDAAAQKQKVYNLFL
jgi:hypothetical protein